jgi:DNA mismatch endonuclease, patch repair protein
MVDTVDAATRSRMMAGIGSRNTRPELLVRRQLHARGFRYTLDGAGLPGRPDIVLPKWKVAIFINGCFWHWHGCHLSKIPDANRTFWETKLMTNQTRDDVSLASCPRMGVRAKGPVG